MRLPEPIDLPARIPGEVGELLLGEHVGNWIAYAELTVARRNLVVALRLMRLRRSQLERALAAHDASASASRPNTNVPR